MKLQVVKKDNKYYGKLPRLAKVKILNGTSDDNSLSCEKYGDLVLITGSFFSNTAISISGWGSYLITQLDTKYRPARRVTGAIIAKNSNNQMIENIGLKIDSDGKVYLQNFNGNTSEIIQMYCNLSYIAN